MTHPAEKTHEALLEAEYVDRRDYAVWSMRLFRGLLDCGRVTPTTAHDPMQSLPRTLSRLRPARSLPRVHSTLSQPRAHPTLSQPRHRPTHHCNRPMQPPKGLL